jgi:16S rRNA (uracil1498-N3)-methyltransferase
MHRFFIPQDWIQSGRITFKDETARQMTRVLRVTRGEQVVALNNAGDEYIGEVLETGQEVIARILKIQKVSGEPTIQLTLFFALSQREKVEWILQKCTEIGVNRFIPFTCARSLVRLDRTTETRLFRWRNILREAAEQSGRGFIPTITAPNPLMKLIECSNEYALAALAWEKEKRISIKALLNSYHYSPIAIMIGPEGGFEEEEVEQLTAGGWRSFSLGDRILRLETAAIVASALVLQEQD